MALRVEFCYNGQTKICPEEPGGSEVFRKMKKWTAILLAIALLVCFSAAAEEAEQSYVENEWNYVDGSMDVSNGIPDNASGVLARIRETGVLRVATEPHFAPQEFIDPDLEGQATYAGADMELARLIAERMGVELEIIPMDFTDVLPAAAEDKCDLVISALSFTPARTMSNEMSKGYFFTDMPANITMVIRAEDAETITKVEDLADKTLVAQRSSLQEAVVVDRIHRYKEFRRVKQTQEVYETVASGKADAGAVDMENAEIYIRNNPDCGLVLVEGLRFTLEEQYAGDRIAAKKGETMLMYFVNGVIDEVVDSGKYSEWYADALKRADELDL